MNVIRSVPVVSVGIMRCAVCGAVLAPGAAMCGWYEVEAEGLLMYAIAHTGCLVEGLL